MIVNAGSGARADESQVSRLVSLFPLDPGELKVERVKSGEELNEVVRRLPQEKDRIMVAAGGDGTVSAVAGALVGTDKTLGVVPLGTLNHFAKDLRIPLDSSAAAQVIRDGYASAVDVGEVNGRTFINNSSIGFYPLVVRDREHQQRHYRRRKWFAFLRAVFNTIARYPVLDLALSVEGQQLRRGTPLLFVGNNRYELEQLEIGIRNCLDAGELSFFVAHATGRLGFLWLAVRAVLGRLHTVQDFDAFCATNAVIHTRRRHLMVAMDGEVVSLATPLHYRILPKALRVLVPRPKTTAG